METMPAPVLSSKGVWEGHRRGSGQRAAGGDSQPHREAKRGQEPARRGGGQLAPERTGKTQAEGGKGRGPGAPPRAASLPLPFGRPRRSKAALRQEESLPGHRGSPGGDGRRVSTPSRGGDTSRARDRARAATAATTTTDTAAAAAAAQRSLRAGQAPPPHRPRPRAAAKRGHYGDGITGAEGCLFSAQCQEIRPGGCQARLPEVGGGRGSGEGGLACPGSWGKGVLCHWGSLALARGCCSESPHSFPAGSGSSSLVLGEPGFPPGQQRPPLPLPKPRIQ